MERGRPAGTWAHAGTWLGLSALVLGACGDGGGGSDTADGGAVVDAGSDAGTEPALGSVWFEIDEARAAEGTLTVETGGELRTTTAEGVAITLSVPPYALASDVDVTLVPLTSVVGVGDDSPSAAVLLKPDGLWLQETASLRFAVETPSDPGLLAFGADPSGESVGAALVDVASDDVVVALRHFRLVGVGVPSDEQREAFYASASSEPELAFEQAVGAVLAEQRRARLSEGEPASHDLTAARASYDRQLLDGLYADAGSSCAVRGEFIAAALDGAWLSTLAGDPLSSQLASRLLDVYGSGAEACEAEALSLCRAGREPGYLLELGLREARLVELLASVDAVSAAVPVPRAPLVEDARAACAVSGYEASVEGDGLVLEGQVDDPHYTFALAGTVNGVSVRVVYTPDSANSNVGTYEYGEPDGPNGSGDYTLSERADGALVIEQTGDHCTEADGCLPSAATGVLSPA
jgi:hypothetical protein